LNLEIIFKELPKDDPSKRKPDLTILKLKLGWKPKIPLSEGLDKTIKLFRELI
tara:strand:- start:11264 stop:11422 length:159 start_codon:yes stop_codon:yes gene_type:complete